MEIYDSRIFHPSTMLICGPSGSGKTSFTLNLLEFGNIIFKPNKPAFLFYFMKHGRIVMTLCWDKIKDR